MFIGRQIELKRLEELYCSDGFEFLVMYGRRRGGKANTLTLIIILPSTCNRRCFFIT